MLLVHYFGVGFDGQIGSISVSFWGVLYVYLCVYSHLIKLVVFMGNRLHVSEFCYMTQLFLP